MLSTVSTRGGPSHSGVVDNYRESMTTRRKVAGMSPDPAADLGRHLSDLARCCDAAVEDLIVAMPLLGDGAMQVALDDCLDALMDALRMLAATSRENAARVPVAPVRRVGAVDLR